MASAFQQNIEVDFRTTKCDDALIAETRPNVMISGEHYASASKFTRQLVAGPVAVGVCDDATVPQLPNNSLN